MRYLNYFLLLILISCSTQFVSNDPLMPYQTAGQEQFFLAELPAWANSSSSGKCFKNHSYQYFDFSKLAAQYQLDYSQMLELQAQYNSKLESYYRSSASRFVKPVEEAAFFNNALENVRAGVKTLKIPKGVKKIDIVLFDQFHSLKKLSEIKKMNQEGKFDETLPLLFSACLSREELEQAITENHLDEIGFYLLSAQWLSPFGGDLHLKTGLHVEIKKLLGEQINFQFVSPQSNFISSEIILE